MRKRPNHKTNHCFLPMDSLLSGHPWDHQTLISRERESTVLQQNTHSFLLLFNQFLLTLNPEVVEVVRISVKLQPFLLVVTIGCELVEIWWLLTSPKRSKTLSIMIASQALPPGAEHTCRPPGVREGGSFGPAAVDPLGENS